MEVVTVLAEHLFFGLLRYYEDSDSFPLTGNIIFPVIAKHIRLGVRDILNTAIVCKEAFKIWRVLINDNLLFRYKLDEYKCYCPKKLTILDKEAFNHFPSPNQLHIMPGTTNLSSLSTITHLFTFDISDNHLPPNLTHLTVYNKFVGKLPSSLLFAEIEDMASSMVSFPPFLSHLFIGRHTHVLPPFPSSLTYLKLGHPLLFPLSSFPLNLKFMYLNYSSHPFPPLPPSLTSLSISSSPGKSLSSLITSLFPPSLTSLELRASSAKPPNFQFPFNKLNLKRLKCTAYWSFDFSFLPPNLQHLEFDGCFDSFSASLPSLLSLTSPFILLPPTPHLKKLHFYTNGRHKISSFPPSVTHLHLGSYPYVIPSLPPCLTHLTFDTYSRALPPLPDTLTHLNLGSSFSQKINKLPPSLLYLSFGGYNLLLPPLPSTLQTLKVGDHFNQIIPNLPPSLTSLSLGSIFDKPITLPPQLKTLQVGIYFYQVILTFPKSLMWISCYEKWYNNHSQKIPPLCYVRVHQENPAPFFNIME